MGIGDSLEMVKASQWVWLMLDSQGSIPNFWSGQEVKHENLMGEDFYSSRNKGTYVVVTPCSSGLTVPPPTHL